MSPDGSEDGGQDFIFEEQSLTKEYWDRVGKDMKVQNDNPIQVSKPSNLSNQDQQKLLKLVLQEGVDAWRKVAETLSLKSSKEAIFEFLRIEDRTILQAQKYLIEHASDVANKIDSDS